MKLGSLMIYVADVPATVRFYEQAFGIGLGFMDERQEYAQMETGETALAFAIESAAEGTGLTVRPNRSAEQAAGIQIALVTEAINEAFERVAAAGGEVVKLPVQRPWGQLMGYVRDNNGLLIEIATPQDEAWHAE